MRDIRISKSESLSVHAQIVEQLRYHLELGTWQPGDKLPTVREFAAALRINYNTVRVAYQELERQGYIVTEQGRGTFVAPNPPRSPASQHESLLDLVDEALLKARSLGIPAEEFARTAYSRAKLFSPAMGGVSLLFVECNRLDLDYYAENIEAHTGLRPDTLFLDELVHREPDFFSRFDLITTTLFHLAEVQEFLGSDQEIIGLMIEPSYLDVLSTIAHFPPGTCVGLVCADENGARQMERALKGVGATHLRFLTAGLDQPDKLEHVLAEADQVYVSRLGLRQRGTRWPEGKAVHEYVDNIDAAALRLLRRRINQLRAECGSLDNS